MTPTQKTRLREAARAFVATVARSTAERVGATRPTTTQRSSWMVPNEAGTGAGSQEFEREVLDRSTISTHYQINMADGFPEQESLERLLTSTGIPRNELRYGWLLPLVGHWMERSDSLTFDDEIFDEVIPAFVEAVAEQRTVTRSRYALTGVEFNTAAVVLDPDLTIRLIEEEELWDFGTVPPYLPFFPTSRRLPEQTWVVIDMLERHGAGDARASAMQPRATRDALLTALVLVTAGRFTLVHLGDETDYGLGALGRSIIGGNQNNVFGGPGPGASIADSEADHLRSEWGRLREVMTASSHYLQLPARRLVDGGSRLRADDATIDYSIGLEALLTAGVDQELSYRFALRGATVLCWDGGDATPTLAGPTETLTPTSQSAGSAPMPTLAQPPATATPTPQTAGSTPTPTLIQPAATPPQSVLRGEETTPDGPDFHMVAYQGQEVLGADELAVTQLFGRGKPVVLNFWAGLCPPCRAEMPGFQRV